MSDRIRVATTAVVRAWRGVADDGMDHASRRFASRRFPVGTRGFVATSHKALPMNEFALHVLIELPDGFAAFLDAGHQFRRLSPLEQLAECAE